MLSMPCTTLFDVASFDGSGVCLLSVLSFDLAYFEFFTLSPCSSLLFSLLVVLLQSSCKHVGCLSLHVSQRLLLLQVLE